MTEREQKLDPSNQPTSIRSHSLRSLAIWSLAIWVLALIMGIAIRFGWLPAIDIPLLTWISGLQRAGLHSLMRLLSLSGHWLTFLILLSILAVLLIRKKQFRTWLILALSSLSTWFMNLLLKISFQRQRPHEFFRIEQSGLSYH